MNININDIFIGSTGEGSTAVNSTMKIIERSSVITQVYEKT